MRAQRHEHHLFSPPWRRTFGVMATTALVTIGMTAGGSVAGATTAPKAVPHHVRLVPHAPRAPLAHSHKLHAARAISPALKKAAPLIAQTAVTHTYVVDNFSDPAVVSAATDCATGNAATCSLRAAVEAANADTGHTDAVSIPSGKSITLTLGAIPLSNTVLISGAGSTVSGGGTSQIFTEDTLGAAPEISGLTLTDGTGTDGGAVYLEEGSLVIDDVTFKANVATSDGGGLYQSEGDLWITGSTFTANTAEYGGGYFSDGGSAQIDSSTFGGTKSLSQGNTAPYGAGIYNGDGDLTVTGSTIEFNTSGITTYGEGVGIYNDELMSITDSIIALNSSTDGGEGVGIENDYVFDGTNLAIDYNVAVGNDTAYGVGFYDDGDVVNLIAVDLIGNGSAVSQDNEVYGGALYTDSDKFTWTGGSVSGTTNQLGTGATYIYIYGGAIYTDNYGADISDVSVSNTTNNAGGDDIYGGAIYNDYSANFEVLTVTSTSSTAAYVYGGVLYSRDFTSVFDATIASTNAHGTYTSGGEVYGGVFYNDDYLSITDATVTGTTVKADLATTPTPSADSSYIYGGLYYNGGVSTNDDLSFTGSTVSATGGDSEIEGGGIYNDDTTTFTDTQVVGLAVAADYYLEGGFLVNYDTFNGKDLTLSQGSVKVLGSTVETHPYADGSIVYSDEPLNVVNGTFDDVSTAVATTGDYNWGFEIDSTGDQLTNSTIANDSVSGPAGAGNTSLIYVDSDESLSLLNTIVSSTTPTLNCALDGSTAKLVSLGNNLDSGTTCGFTHPGDIESAAPDVLPVANNGGEVETGALQVDSPAINAGASAGCPSTDARGVARPQGGACDIGAYEVIQSLPGYILAASDGGIFNFGPGASFHGSLGGVALTAPIVGVAIDPATGGYWEVGSDGGVFGFDAPFHGSTGGVKLAKPIVGIASTPDGGGYWLVASDGGVFAFGDAHFYGSTGGITLNKPIVGIAADPLTGGYWLVASDGGIFNYNAPFFGSTGDDTLSKPVVGIAAAPKGNGYWLVASDGGVFNFGPGAPFFGSTGGITLSKPIVGIGVDPATGGYWLVASDGGIFAYNATFYGSTGGVNLTKPIVGAGTL